jgi:hypothetical protein
MKRKQEYSSNAKDLFCNATYHHDNDDWQRHIQAFAVASSTSLNNMQLPQPIFLCI